MDDRERADGAGLADLLGAILFELRQAHPGRAVIVELDGLGID